VEVQLLDFRMHKLITAFVFMFVSSVCFVGCTVDEHRTIKTVPIGILEKKIIVARYPAGLGSDRCDTPVIVNIFGAEEDLEKLVQPELEISLGMVKLLLPDGSKKTVSGEYMHVFDEHGAYSKIEWDCERFFEGDIIYVKDLIASKNHIERTAEGVREQPKGSGLNL